MSGNPLDDIVFTSSRDVRVARLTMSSFQIADLVEKRHDNVKRTIETLADQGIISRPQIEEVKIQRQRRAETVSTYVFSGERGKRDSIVVVAQLSPEFTARLVDRWQELERQVATHQPPATSREVTVVALESEALGQVGGVVRNVARRQSREMLRTFEDAIDQAVIEYVGVAVPRLNAFVQELTAKHVQPLSDKVDQLISEMREMRSARQTSVDQPIALPRMGLRTFRKMRGWSMAKMGKMVGATASAVAKHEHGVCIPAPHIMDRYFEASGGRLTPDTFYDAYRARWGGVRPRSTRQPVTTNVSEGEE